MSIQRGKIRVLRSKFTSRAILGKDRYNFVIEVRATVHPKSYLLICGSEYEHAKPGKVREAAISLGEEVLNRGVLGDIKQLLSKYRLRVDIKVSNKNIMLGGRPIIPGSSLKGAIRSRLEYKFVVKNSETYSCYSVIDKNYTSNRFKKRRHLEFWGRDIDVFIPTCNPIKWTDVCRVCDIFGAPGLASRINVGDLHPINPRLSMRTVRIGRFSYSVIPPRENFRGVIYATNFNLEDLGLLLLSMEIYTDSPLIIGRFKYKYNPRVGGRLRDGYYVGLLNLSIENITGYPMTPAGDVDEIIKMGKEAIQHYIDEGYIDINRGVLEIG